MIGIISKRHLIWQPICCNTFFNQMNMIKAPFHLERVGMQFWKWITSRCEALCIAKSQNFVNAETCKTNLWRGKNLFRQSRSYPLFLHQHHPHHHGCYHDHHHQHLTISGSAHIASLLAPKHNLWRGKNLFRQSRSYRLFFHLLIIIIILIIIIVIINILPSPVLRT